jgi:hypothetical protein
MPELRKPKSKIVWRPAFQQEREHKSPAAWVNDMLVESKDG